MVTDIDCAIVAKQATRKMIVMEKFIFFASKKFSTFELMNAEIALLINVFQWKDWSR